MTVFKNISIYTYSSLTLLIMGIVTKGFLVDPEVGSRFKNFSHQLLCSDITFSLAILVFIVGQIFRVIKNNRNSKISETRVLWNCILILPLFFLIAATPFLETFVPELSHSDNFLSVAVVAIGVIGTLSFLVWIFFFPITIIQQLSYILTSKSKN